MGPEAFDPHKSFAELGIDPDAFLAAVPQGSESPPDPGTCGQTASGRRRRRTIPVRRS
jgi:hypothetical protein